MVDIPGYTIERELGRGGMATVFQAIQQSVERRVALKVMSPVLLVDRTFSERFMREAKIAANLYHPHVVAIHDVGLFENHHYIAMELLSGGDLSERGRSQLEIVDILRIAKEIAGALDYAHSKGFVHRDVKPENILFREDDAAVLTDFGIARAVNSVTQMTKTGAVIGTPQYMSPEQARGKELDGRSDLYGLGIVLYEMLTGAVPFEGNDSVAVGIKHVTEPVPRLPEYMGYIQPLLDRLLAKHREERYQTGGEAVVELGRIAQDVAANDPAIARPTPRERATRISEVPEARTPPHWRSGVAATPRPDGTLRQEPMMGSLADIGSFDRTVGQPILVRRPSPRPSGGGLKRWFFGIALLAAAASVAWWQRDTLSALLPNSEVAELLQRAQAAADAGRWYGDTSSYASVLYQRAMQIEPGNRQARAGLELVATHLAERAEQAAIDGNEQQARLLLQRARELAPGLPRLDTVARRLDGGLPTGPGEIALDPVEEPNAQIDRLLSAAQAAMERERLVRPAEDNAHDQFRAVLRIDPDNSAARTGLAQIERQLRSALDTALASGATATVEQLLADLGQILSPTDARALAAEVNQTQARARRQQEAAALQARVDSTLAQADAALAADRLMQPVGVSAVDYYTAALALQPDNQRARDGLVAVARRYLQQAEVALEADRLEEAESLIQRVEQIQPGIVGIERARRRLALYRQQNANNRPTLGQQDEIVDLMRNANTALEQGNLMRPPGQSAYDLFKAVLRLSPRHPGATNGLRDLSSQLSSRSGEALAAGDLERALTLLTDAEQTDPGNADVPRLTTALAAALRRDARAAIAASQLSLAATLLEQAARLQPNNSDLERLQLELGLAKDQG